MDSDPIKQLQGLLHDPAKVLEKITSIHSALDSIRTHVPRLATAEGLSVAGGETVTRLGSTADDPVYGRLLLALREMQAQIEERIQPLATELARQEIARLREQSDEQQNALKKCLAEIDQNILNCFARMDEYQRRSADITALNDRLVDLGAAPEPPPEAPGAAADCIIARLESLRLEGKI